ncbi:MAG: DUF3160 domain-containing protein [Armatimonadetes bacterium]|nr:DUF3160 domain-containing protein [Armatimonadota bacterium]
MADFGKLCKALKIASEAELAGADLRADETMSKAFQGIPGDEEWHFYIGAFGQWLLENFSPVVAEEHPCLVVDVAADSNPPNRVLHEATGPFQLVVIPGRKRDYLYGWVLSHYEFSEDNFTRLTDSDWEKRVDKGRHRELRPEWTNSYVYPG